MAATAAFAVAVMNNFWWNRHWTFRARGGHAGFQAARFFTVSIAAFLFAAAMLELLVSVAGVAELPAQAISIVAATPAELHREQDVELPHRAVARLAALALALLLVAARRCPPAAPRVGPRAAGSQTQPPRFFERSAREVERIAARGGQGARGADATGRSSRPRTRRESAAGR